MDRICKIRCFVFIAAPTVYEPWSGLFLNSYALLAAITNILTNVRWVKSLSVCCLFRLKTNLKPIDMGVQKTYF